VFKATFKESPGIEVFYKPRTQTVDFKEDKVVAVKVLGGKKIFSCHKSSKPPVKN